MRASSEEEFKDEVQPMIGSNSQNGGGRGADVENGPMSMMSNGNGSSRSQPRQHETPETSLPTSNGHKKPPTRHISKQASQGKYVKEHVELYKTGKWGKIGKYEIIAVVVGVILIVAGVVGAVLGLVVFKESTTPETLPPRPLPPTPAPSEFPENDPAFQLFAILTEIASTTLIADNSTLVLQSSLDALPQDPTFYTEDRMNDATQPAVVRAMSWILTTDPRDVSPDSVWLIPRFALATLYYSTNGDTSWINTNNWLTAERVCDWHGVFCNRFRGAVQELDLNTNGLAGPIPPELVLLQSVYGIVFTQNELTGPPPFTALGNMPVLSFLFLDNNQLTGEISDTVRDNNVLTTLMVQRNEFTGAWPRAFCDRLEHLLQNFGADCTEVDLTRCVCCPKDYERNNCF